MNKTTSPTLSKNSLQSSALRGAAFAFQTSPTPSPSGRTTPDNARTGANGALAAAIRAGLSPGQIPHNGLAPPAGVGQQSLAAGRQAALRSSPSYAPKTSEATTTSRQQSPSYIAATRAAARSPAKFDSPSPSAATKDETSVAPAAKLVKLFEEKQRSATLPSARSSEDGEKSIASTKPILSPTPIRPSLSLRIRPSTQSNVSAATSPKSPVRKPSQQISFSRPERTTTAPVSRANATDSPLKPSWPPANAKSKEPPALPAPRKKLRPQSIQASPSDVAAIKNELDPTTNLQPSTSLYNATTKPPPATVKPTLRRSPPPSLPPRQPIRRTTSTLSNSTSPPPPPLPRRTPISTTIPTTRPLPLPRPKSSSLTPQLTADSLANAMVASSLASTRRPSPSHSTTPHRGSLSLSRHPSLSSLHRSLLPSRSPSPGKPSPQSAPLHHVPMSHKTLRPSPSRLSPGEDLPGPERNKGDHRYLGGMIKKHPNKHAEGTRKRWMGSVSEEERRRYEGVWAANKGGVLGQMEERARKALGLESEEGGEEWEAMGPEDVHGFVVRDIWARSGAEGRVLEEVWELVEGGGREARGRRGRGRKDGSGSGSGERRRGWLKRDEFVVGMWLVDQALKGRKLPVEVGESVWASARGLMSGLMVR